ncbi:hypothetical protein D3C73_906070 [compost metagenome]
MLREEEALAADVGLDLVEEEGDLGVVNWLRCRFYILYHFLHLQGACRFVKYLIFNIHPIILHYVLQVLYQLLV